MEFKSKKQEAWIKENKPELYDEMMAGTKDFDKLPIKSPKEKAKEKAARRKNGKRARNY